MTSVGNNSIGHADRRENVDSKDHCDRCRGLWRDSLCCFVFWPFCGFLEQIWVLVENVLCFDCHPRETAGQASGTIDTVKAKIQEREGIPSKTVAELTI